MKDWPDNCVDLVLTDPPYGININKKANNYGNCTHLSRKATNEKWDKLPMSPSQWSRMKVIGVNQIVFGANYFWPYFGQAKCFIVWDKRGNLPTVPFSPMELMWTSFNKMPVRYTVLNHGFITDMKEPRKLHPTQKPLLLMEKILNDFSKPNDLILDPFCGSGTTCVAAKRSGRRYIGIDISEEYCDIARKRLKQIETGISVKHQKQGFKGLLG